MNIKHCLRSLTLLAALFIVSGTMVQAQNPQRTIIVSGKLIDTVTMRPVENVSCYLFDEKKALIRSVLSQPGGLFSFGKLDPLWYKIELVASGYQSLVITVNLADSTRGNHDLGIIYLSKKITGLKEVTITARKPLIKQEIDRISYDLQADPDSKASTVLEMMRKVPYLSLDAEENILLKGNQGFRIFINGKPSGMMERNAREVLRSMPASTIQRIEVITNPPSKYDAEGLAGIINIITHKKNTNGYNGTLNISERFPTGGPGFGGSFSIKEGIVGISAYGGASLYKNPSASLSVSRFTYGNIETGLQQNGNTSSDSRNGYYGADISVEIDSLHLVSAQLNLNGSRSVGTNLQQSLLHGKNRVIQSYDLMNDNNGSGAALDAAINYQLGFRSDKNRLLTLSYRYLQYTGKQNSLVAITNPVNYPLPGYEQDNSTFSGEHTTQVDYVQQVNKLYIEAGVKAIFRNNKSDFQYNSINAVTGNPDTDTSRLNRFDYGQHIFGAYNAYRYNLKKWELKAGIRIEETVIDANFRSSFTRVKQDYLHFIPSVAAQHKLTGNSNLNFGLSQRIKRPGINRLNPFIDRSNPYLETRGNPALKPVVSNRVQVAYGIAKKFSFNTGLDFTIVKKIDLKVSYFDPATNITQATYENTGNARAIDYSFNAGYPITAKWNASINGTISYIHLEGTVNKAAIENNYVLYNFSASSGYRFDKGWRLAANINVNGPNLTSLQGTSNRVITSSFSVNKEIVKQKISFSAGLNNPFTRYRHNVIKTIGPDFTELIDSRNYFRMYSFSLNYNFGKLKQAIKKNKRGIRNDDVSEGKGM